MNRTALRYLALAALSVLIGFTARSLGVGVYAALFLAVTGSLAIVWAVDGAPGDRR